MAEQPSTISIICNRCEVGLQFEEDDGGQERVYCPVCGADFGRHEDVVRRLPDKRFEPYRDLNGWRIAQ